MSRAVRAHRLYAALMPTFMRAVHAIPKPQALAFVATAAAVPDTGTEPEEPIGSSAFWWRMGISVLLVLLGGVFAGLTLGLMGLDELHLRVLATSSEDPKERRNANKGVCAFAKLWEE
jgi:hypothetical protein